MQETLGHNYGFRELNLLVSYGEVKGMTKIQEIRKEYGEPFREVVRGYARMGYSKTATAQVLEISLSYFRQLLTRFDLHRFFDPSTYNDSCKSYGYGSGKGWPKGVSRDSPVLYSDQYLLARVSMLKVSWIFDQFAPPYSSTVRRRFGSWNRAKELAGGMQ